VQTLPTILADQLQVKHVIANLIDNAIKYTGDKPNARIVVSCREDGEYYRVAVKDNGIGIPENQQGRIFQLYQRGTEQLVAGIPQGGAGIGLAIAKRIVERWGGELVVHSVLGEGSEFAFTIPKKVSPAYAM
jgi:signal transduction histidine kinase